MKIIVVSETNTASKNIGNILRERSLRARFFEVRAGVLELDKYESEFLKLAPELIIVASSHKSEAGIPMLNCHTTGNWGDDVSHKGLPRKLSIAPALYLRAGVLEFQKLKQENPKLKDYEIGLEATHHSPTIDFPVMFVEVGSTEKQWGDLEACKAAADVICKLATETPEKVTTAIGFGGGHYCPHFNKRLITEKIAFGHICPKYAADAVDEETVIQAFNKTVPKPDFAMIEWKGLSGLQRKKIIDILDKNGLPWKKF
ncbi:MAG: D-aminoacyl-tRNA deacylase [archaeon]